MTDDQMPCPHCGNPYCFSLIPGSACCGKCSGNHADDTYDLFYPSTDTNQENS